MNKNRIPADPTLTSIAIAWRNPESSLIADAVMPKCQPVGTEQFKYFAYDLSDGFTVPQTLVGRRGQVNEVDFGGKELESATEDHGLEDPIPVSDIEAAKSRGINIVGDSVEYIMNLLQLDREVCVADLVQNSANYGAKNVEALSGTDMFSDPAAKPLEVLHDALESMYIKPNTIVMSAKTWGLLRRHETVTKKLNPASGGSANRQQLAAELEVERVLVGGAFVNTARKGQAVQMERTWGNSIALHYQDPQASNRRGMTWGLTVPQGKPVAMQWFDGDIGLRGGTRVRAGESLKELVVCPDAGYLIKNVY